MSSEAYARSLVARADVVVILTGAGISAESGVPTFRGHEGLWQSFRPEDLATPEAFDRDPRLVWEWYSWRRERVGRCVPNAAHLAAARLALTRGGVRIITQNVDELHSEAARATARDADPGPALPLELHGSLFRDRCTMCAYAQENRLPVDTSSLATLPRCEQCGALLRPDVIWFGESLVPGAIQEAIEWASRADVCVVIGTSGAVQPAASIALVAREHGGAIVEVNPDATPLTSVATVALRSKAAEIVPRILG
jgi:NAD-dependent deacetylase